MSSLLLQDTLFNSSSRHIRICYSRQLLIRPAIGKVELYKVVVVGLVVVVGWVVVTVVVNVVSLIVDVDAVLVVADVLIVPVVTVAKRFQ